MPYLLLSQRYKTLVKLGVLSRSGESVLWVGTLSLPLLTSQNIYFRSQGDN